jgi:AraC-like DNA-binding protein
MIVLGMQYTLLNLDRSQMQLVKIDEVRPRVRIANHHRVGPAELWERSIPDLQLISVLCGIFTYAEAEKGAIKLEAGDILFIEPNICHSFTLAPGQEEGWIAGMHFEFIPQGRWAAGDYRLSITPDRITRIEEPGYLQGRFTKMAAFYGSYRPYRQELVDSLAMEIILLLAVHWQNEVLWAAKPSARMDKMLAYIREQLDRPLTRRDLAREFNLSEGYVNQLFQSELGMTPSAVINRERLACAYQLMERDGLSVAESAFRVGFQDPFYFSRLFKKVYTIPPSGVASKRRRQNSI